MKQKKKRKTLQTNNSSEMESTISQQKKEIRAKEFDKNEEVLL